MIPNRKPNRLKEFDYTSDNLYYITTNVKNRYKCFGRIQNEIIHLNILGDIVKTRWLWLEVPSVGTGRDLSLQKELQNSPDAPVQRLMELKLNLFQN